MVYWRQQAVCERVGIRWRACGKGRLCHIGHMKVVSIRELHEHTGELVRHALKEPILVTDRGQQVAVLKSITGTETSGKPFPKRKLSSLPKVEVDSTIYISEERDAR
jgi:antitoxin (DNA-binding transcriptional repressor) of toxin-antitoxin stability system